MNYERTNPIGIDIPIEKVKKVLYNTLSERGQIDGYGRVYKKISSGYYSLEAYVSDNEYKGVLGTDTSRFFFNVFNQEETHDDDPSAQLDIIFMLNLEDFYQTSERKDEDFISLVISVLKKTRFKVEKVLRGEEYLDRLVNGLKTGNTLVKPKNFYNDNLHPRMIFTVRGNVNFNYKTCI